MKNTEIKIINKNKTEIMELEKIKWIIEKMNEEYSVEAVNLALKHINIENI